MFLTRIPTRNLSSLHRNDILGIMDQILGGFDSKTIDLAGSNKPVTFVAAASESCYSKRGRSQLSSGTRGIPNGQILVNLEPPKERKGIRSVN